MALQKTIATQFNVNATYWKIISISIDWLNRTAHLSLCGYKDKDTRDRKLQPLVTINYDFKDVGFPFTTEGKNLVEAYTKLKTLPEWKGAVDLL